MLNFKLALKMIITLGYISFISLRITFGGNSSYSNFRLLVEPMTDIMNKSLHKNRLLALYQKSNYSEY